MAIALTIPSFVPHGGIRVIMEWANRLSLIAPVLLLCRDKRAKSPDSWFQLSPRVRVIHDERELKKAHLLIICSPHDIDLEYCVYAPSQKFLFLQMLEHLFRPGDCGWRKKCTQMYSSRNPLITISKWNKDHILKHYPNRGEIYYVGNGVNLEHFPIETKPQRRGKVVLVEGWNALNPTKDYARIAPRVALRLKQKGYRILAYSQKPLVDYQDVPNKFYQLPDLATMNELYSMADILLKASQYDARSCSPMEAMTKGTVTARAIIQGDDDLEHMRNCLRVGYDVNQLYTAAMDLLTDDELREKLGHRCQNHVQFYSWEYWMKRIREVLCI